MARRLPATVTFLPIVERELRVASRRPGTFWLRVAAALVALMIGGGFFCATLVPYVGLGSDALGRGLFTALTWLSLAAALSAGLFLTSDCLSEEKREGTLGFLFLTDLRGYDVVLGKLLATSLRGVYALLAIFPILAVTLMLGGVSGAEFWMTILALLNALFVSLVAGLFVSAISRDSQRALAGTLLLLVALSIGGPAGDAIIATARQRGFDPVLSLSSPGYLFLATTAGGGTRFWPAWLINQVLGWALLGLACRWLPRLWQEKTSTASPVKVGWAYAWKFGGARHREALRRKLIDSNPVLWLACRQRWQALALWGLTLALVGGFVAVFSAEEASLVWFAWSFFAGAMMLVWYLATASQAGRFFVDARRSGLIELLLATPLTVRQIVQGQWRALLRLFAAPLTLCLAAQLLGAFLVQSMTWNRFATALPPAPAVTTTGTNASPNVKPPTNATRTTVVTTTPVGPRTRATVTATAFGGGFTVPGNLVTLIVSFAATLTGLANLAALGWFGMWSGLNSKSANAATLKTIVFVQVIPWFVITFAATLVIPLLLLPALLRRTNPGPAWVMTYPMLQSLLVTVLALGKDIAFSLWARRKLYSDFRERAVRTVAPIRLALPPPLPRVGAPPVIAPGGRR